MADDVVPPTPNYRDFRSLGSRDWPPGHKLAGGQYEVDREIGAGGMGKVYLVHTVANPAYRFAVKRTQKLDDFSRRAFLAELRTWIVLPSFPHIVACRFFREENDEVLIFAEYVEGVSLDRWIKDNEKRSVEQIFDIAVQFAWGLHQCHELGVAHQDVKPANALIDKHGVVKVTDFGLSQARYFSGEAIGENIDPKHTNRGCTPPYRSPEQARRERLTRQTDIWSWAASVLEMFIGTPTWDKGENADEAFEEYLATPYGNGNITMPSELTEVLRWCLQFEPEKRPATILQAAEALIAANSGYSKPTPTFMRAAERTKAASDRRTAHSAEWKPAAVVLAKALHAAGRDVSEAARFLEQAEATRRGQAVDELAGYDEAKRIYEDLIRRGQKGVGEELAGLCVEKALLHLHLEDINTAISEYDRAIAIRQRLVNQEGRSELSNNLAAAYMNKGNALRVQGNLAAAVLEYDRAIAILERLVNQEGRSELSNNLAAAYMNKGNALRVQGNLAAAVLEYDRAIAIRERLVNQEGRSELGNDLAGAYINKGNALQNQGNLAAAVLEYDRAIAILERLVNQEGRSELGNDLAAAYMNKGVALRDQGNLAAAVLDYDRAIAILERLVNQEGRSELSNNLAAAYMNKGNALRVQGNLAAAVLEYDRAIAIRERLVNQEGRSELSNDLAGAYMNKGNALRVQGNLAAAVLDYDRAIAIRERLVNQGRSELSNDLAGAYMNKGNALGDQGNLAAAVLEYDRAIAILERLVNQEGRSELSNDLAAAYMNKGVALRDQGNLAAAVLDCDRAIAIRERLVNQEGRSELSNNLAMAYVNRATLWRSRGESVKARQDADRAMKIVNAPENRSTAAVREKIVETAEKIKDDASSPAWRRWIRRRYRK